MEQAKSNALVVALRATGVLASKAKEGKVIEIKRRDMTLEQVDAADQKALDGEFSATRQEALETIAVLSEDIRYTIDSKRAAIAECVAIMYPAKRITSATWDQHHAATNFLRTRSQYAYREYVRAVKAYFGALPTASGKKGAKKGARQSPKLWLRSVDTSIAALAEKIGKMPAKDIDRNVAREFVETFKRLTAMAKIVRKAVNE